jgi:hypothetical protein
MPKRRSIRDLRLGAFACGELLVGDCDQCLDLVVSDLPLLLATEREVVELVLGKHGVSFYLGGSGLGVRCWSMNEFTE